MNKTGVVRSLLIVVLVWILLIAAAVHVIVITQEFDHVGSELNTFLEMKLEQDRTQIYLQKSAEIGFAVAQTYTAQHVEGACGEFGLIPFWHKEGKSCLSDTEVKRTVLKKLAEEMDFYAQTFNLYADPEVASSSLYQHHLLPMDNFVFSVEKERVVGYSYDPLLLSRPPIKYAFQPMVYLPGLELHDYALLQSYLSDALSNTTMEKAKSHLADLSLPPYYSLTLNEGCYQIDEIVVSTVAEGLKQCSHMEGLCSVSLPTFTSGSASVLLSFDEERHMVVVQSQKRREISVSVPLTELSAVSSDVIDDEGLVEEPALGSKEGLISYEAGLPSVQVFDNGGSILFSSPPTNLASFPLVFYAHSGILSFVDPNVHDVLLAHYKETSATFPVLLLCVKDSRKTLASRNASQEISFVPLQYRLAWEVKEYVPDVASITVEDLPSAEQGANISWKWPVMDGKLYDASSFKIYCDVSAIHSLEKMKPSAIVAVQEKTETMSASLTQCGETPLLPGIPFFVTVTAVSPYQQEGEFTEMITVPATVVKDDLAPGFGELVGLPRNENQLYEVESDAHGALLVTLKAPEKNRDGSPLTDLVSVSVAYDTITFDVLESALLHQSFTAQAGERLERTLVGLPNKHYFISVVGVDEEGNSISQLSFSLPEKTKSQ